MATFVPPKKNTAYTFYWSLVSQADTKTFQANPTLSAGDVKVAIDDGAPANLATLPTVDGDFTKRIKVELSAAEMNGDNITVLFSDAAGAEWCDVNIALQTSALQVDDLATGAVAATIAQDTTTDIPAQITALSAHGDLTWATATGFSTLTAAQVWAEATRTLTAFTTPVTLADGSITDAKIVWPAEAPGRPGTALASMRRVWEWVANRRTRDRATGSLLLYADNGVTVLETQTQSTVGTVDQQTEGA